MKGFSAPEMAKRQEIIEELQGNRKGKLDPNKTLRKYINKLEDKLNNAQHHLALTQRYMEEAQQRSHKYQTALEEIASYKGFEDGAIMLSAVARTALGWEGYE